MVLLIENMFEWANDHPELFKICTLFNLTELSNPERVVYKSLQGYIQEGPQCGLVALAIACEQPNKKFVQYVLDIAKEHDLTYNGEIFSSLYMERLARIVLPINSIINSFYGDLDCEKTRKHLFEGGLILVPYDADKNNYPGFYNGHKAHWAIVCGAVETPNNFYVIVRHGKAKNVAFWLLQDLCKSNRQLNEFSPDRKLDTLKYKIPDGGLNGCMGLRNSAVFIKLYKNR
ncbi:hypothetical protein HHI36_016221 [Cryptolaemus montrouzieri]|uniref:Actin maturation protease n=1 Tax=Cryptolaemus montrouzieri TaxID=559131 RepID=A0ABD2NJK5_9CUCU